MTRRDIRDNTSGGPVAQNAAAQSHTSELTRGSFCFRVSTGGLRWAPQMSRFQVGREPARQKAREGYISLSLRISAPSQGLTPKAFPQRQVDISYPSHIININEQTSHPYNIYTWAGESWTLFLVVRNVLWEREQSHLTVDLPRASNVVCCNYINSSKCVNVPCCQLFKRLEFGKFCWFLQICGWGFRHVWWDRAKISCRREQQNIH